MIVFDDADVDALVENAHRGSATTTPARTAPPRAACSPGRGSTTTSWPAGRGGRRHQDRRSARPRHRDGPGGVGRAARTRARGFVDRARDAGAEVAAGGERARRRRVLLRAVRRRRAGQDAEIVQREVFGPVVTVQRFADDDAGARAGRTASTTASPPACGRATSGGRCRWRSDLQFGTVWVNDHIPIVSELPHGGFKQSGYGKDMSIYAIEEYTEIKHVMVKCCRRPARRPITVPTRAPARSPTREQAASSPPRRLRRRCSSGRKRTCRTASPPSFQADDPYPIYLARGQGAHVWDVDGTEYVDFHGGFGVNVVGHAHPKIVEAIERAARTGTHFAATTEDTVAVRRGAVPALPPRPGAVRELGHRGDDGRHPHRAGRDRARRRREDRGLVPRPPRHRDVLGRAERRRDGRARPARVGRRCRRASRP